MKAFFFKICLTKLTFLIRLIHKIVLKLVRLGQVKDEKEVLEHAFHMLFPFIINSKRMRRLIGICLN